MFYVSLTLLLVLQVRCEWVEISQQHYQKPLKVTHHHPLLATVEKATTRPIHLLSATTSHPLGIPKVFEDERTSKRNRIYMNHTILDNSWVSTAVQKMPTSVNDVKLESSFSNFEENHEFVTRKQSGTNDKGDILIIRTPKPDRMENSVKSEHNNGYRTLISGKRVHPTNAKGSHSKPNPLEDYKESIEVLNMSELEYTTAEDTFDIKLDTDMDHKRKASGTTPKVDRRNTSTLPSKSTSPIDQRNSQPNVDSSTRYPTTLKDINKMRRVEILHTTKATLIDESEDTKKVSNSAKPELFNEGIKNSGKDTTTPYKFPSIGHVKRVHITTSTPKVSLKSKPEKIYTEAITNDFTAESERTENNIRRIDKPTSHHRATTETPDYFKAKSGKPKLSNRDRNLNVPDPEEVMLEELITGEENKFDIKVHKVASIGTVMRVPNPTKVTKVHINKINRQDINVQLTEPSSEMEEEGEAIVENEDFSSYNNIYKSNDNASTSEEISILTTTKPKKNTATRAPDVNPQIKKYELNPYKPVKHNVELPEFVTKDDDFGNDAETVENTESTIKTQRNKVRTESNNRDTYNIKEKSSVNNAVKDSKSQRHKNVDRSDEDEDPLSEDNAMENLIKFLKTVTDIIARNTRRGVRGKLKYLEDLRDTIMANIEERLEAAFPDDAAGPPGSRHARSAEPRGHVEFPSSEGALMTISFLTFAVFLIKLVLQVIQAYKNKTMMMMPAVVAAVGRAYSEQRSNNPNP